ncbi:DUF1707 SHOCT-like domain-containing protein [Saccharopolyspora gregorii]|uniref:DUF1707 SHOCT-like domain-containing protein n=1 Tax=Saccharopolyspora gregorii TaxID=33914 RepID=UPI0021AD49B8|nr:DUF1707 domain-containing protein [Saccharopolyspora gregorii]
MSAVTHVDVPAQDGGIRLSDADRAQGMRLLNEQVAAGCLTSEEFADRAIQLEHERTRAELLAPFRDLPQPRPSFDDAVPAERPTALPPAEPARPTPHLRYLITAVVAPCAIVGALTGLESAAAEPSLLLASLVVAGLYLVQLVAGYLSAR